MVDTKIKISCSSIKFRTFLLFLGLAVPATEGIDENFGWLTPLHVDPNSACFKASLSYVEAFGVANDLSKNMTWGPLMMDADGRLPMEGFLSDTIPIPVHLCEMLNGTAAENCNKLPSSLTNVLIHFPFGFHHNPGNMDLCLEGVHTKWGFRTKYCTIYMIPPDIGIGGIGSPWRQEHSYLGMLANLVEMWERMKSLAAASVSGKDNATEIFGFGQFKFKFKFKFKFITLQVWTIQRSHGTDLKGRTFISYQSGLAVNYYPEIFICSRFLACCCHF